VGSPSTTIETLPTIPHSVALQDQNPAEVDNSTLPVTSLSEMHKIGNPPDVDISTYRLEVSGLVDHPLSLDYQTLMTYATVSEVVLLICPGYFADNPRWTGLTVASLLDEAGVKAEANQVVFTALDRWDTELPLSVARQEKVILALKVDEVTLPLDHGYPLRLVLPGYYGSEWIRWLSRIEVK
jgi:DMSO/TMAO reductase YedYZ molybdopterin-dependent catalytic subunit